MSAFVTCLIDDHAPPRPNMAHEHGVSFHIAVDGKNILFDCGMTDMLLKNAAAADVDLRNLDMVVFSHCHFDHGGGFPAVAALGGVGRIVVGPGFFEKKFTRTGLRHGYMGVPFDEKFLVENSIACDVCDGIMRLSDNCWAMGGVPRLAAEESIPSRYTLRKNGRFVPDEFGEEISVVTRMDDGIAVFVGCSHRGIVNILRFASERFGLPVRGVWGGTHLLEADGERLSFTLDALKGMGIRVVGFSHCSGDAALEKIAADPYFEDARLCAGEGVELVWK